MLESIAEGEGLDQQETSSSTSEPEQELKDKILNQNNSQNCILNQNYS